MSAYAYRDRNRTEVIYASEAMTENIDTLFIVCGTYSLILFTC